MVRQHCPECGSEVPVDDVTGVCHVGHRVNSPAAPAGSTSSAFPSSEPSEAAADEPAPWVATVDDDDEPEEPRRDADPTAPPPPSQALGSATVPPADTPPASSEVVQSPDEGAPVTGFAAAAEAADGGPEPFSAGTDDHGPEPETSGESLEELAAMAAATGTSAAQPDTSDLSRLSDDLRGDLGPEVVDAGEDFDLGALEEAVAELDGSATAPPHADLTPEAPGPDAAPGPAVAVADVPQVPSGMDDLDDLDALHDDEPAAPAPVAEADAAGHGADEPVSIRPDHDAPADQPAASAPLDPTNFTASGKRVSAPKAGSSGGGDGLVDKLKGLFSR